MFCYFAPVTRHSFHAMCAVFSRKDFFRLFDGLLRISTRKTNADPRCLTSLGGHVGAIWAAKDLELVHVHHWANPYTDLTNSLQETKYFLRETNTVFRDTNNSLRGTKYFLREINSVFGDTNNSLWGTKYFLRETKTVFGDTNNSLRGTKYFLREFLKPVLSFETQITPFGESNISFRKPILSFETQLILFEEPLEKQII